MADVISTNQFKTGMHIEHRGAMWRIIDFQHVKPGKGGAFVRTKLKNLETGAVIDDTFRAGEKFTRVHTETKNVQFLYDDGNEAHFMDEQTYEQFGLPRAEVADELAVHPAVVDGADSRGQRQAVGPPAALLGRAGRHRDRARRQGGHGLQRDEAGHARNGRGRSGATVRQRRRPDQGRPARSPLHLARLAAPDSSDDQASAWSPSATVKVKVHDNMPQIVDTTIRLLSQDPLAGKLPTGEVLRIAEILDSAGFAYLEVSGGGVFDSAVRLAVESPWERIRAIDARTTTPLGLALRGRFLTGSRPVSADIVRRFVSCAADNGIDIFRLHDPLNDVSNLLEAGEAILAAGKEFHVGLVYSAGREGEIDALVERAKQLPALGATRVILNDPTDALLPHLTEELVQRIGAETGLPVGLFVQGAAGTGLLNAVVATRVGADLIATAIYPLALTLHRVSGESLVDALHGLGRETGVDTAPLWEACDLVDEHIGDQPVAPVAPRIAVRAAEYDLPAGLVAALDVHLRAHAAGDRLLDTLTEVVRIRAESGWPPLASPIGQILASQALLNVLSARRYGTVLDEFRMLVEGAYGTTPAPIEESVLRAVELVTGSGGGLDDDPPSAEDVREAAEGLAASEEDLVLLAMFGQEAETLLQSIRQRHSRETSLLLGDVDATRAERIRELVKIVQESGVGEIEIEDEGMRVSVRRADEVGVVAAPLAAIPEGADAELPSPGRATTRVESPMVGVFYRSSSPGSPAFVEVGDVVSVGQTLCLLEAMKLFNELKAEQEGRVKAIYVESGQPVEFGQLLFELEPADTQPIV